MPLVPLNRDGSKKDPNSYSADEHRTQKVERELDRAATDARKRGEVLDHREKK